MARKIDYFRRLISLAAALAAIPGVAWAIAEDQCERDRNILAKNWKEIPAKTLLFVCHDHYVSEMKVLLTPRDTGDFTLTVAVEGEVYRAIILGKDVGRLRAQTGSYVLNSEKSCLIRGNLSAPAILHFGEPAASGDFGFFSAHDSLDYIDCEAPK
jgi:hypothetical protein